MGKLLVTEDNDEDNIQKQKESHRQAVGVSNATAVFTDAPPKLVAWKDGSRKG